MYQLVKEETADQTLLATTQGYCKMYHKGTLLNLALERPDELHLSMILPESAAGLIKEAIRSAQEAGMQQLLTYTSLVDGKEETYQSRVIPFKEDLCIVVIQNITKAVEYKARLDKKNAYLKAILSNIVTRVLVFDNEGRLTMSNRESEGEYLPATTEEALEYGKAFLKEDGMSYFNLEEQPLYRAINGETVLNQIVMYREIGYTYRTYLINALPLVTESGNREGVILTARDVSDISTTQHRLKAKEKDLESFMYRASHDLKSPLLSMKGVLDFASKKISDPETHIYLNLLQKSHRHLYSVVEDLISLTHLSRKEVVNTEINLSILVSELVQSLQLLPQANGIKINACLPGNLPVFVDEGLLRTVLQNLIVNAINHHRTAGEGRYVRVCVYNRAHDVLIEVLDNGIGIAREIQSKVYDVFFRGNPNASGSGLGLFIVKEAVAKLRGNIELVSEQGVGTTFSVMIPKK